MTTKPSLRLPESISVRTLASLLEVDPSVVISKLMTNGVITHINQNLDYDTAALLVEEFDRTAEPEDRMSTRVTKTSQSKSAVSRPPIVTIMGHVDHGKTSLLDYIRQASVAKSESGGITQHISAYQIEFQTNDKQLRKITFVDTPGHEAFSALRAHGATITDVVVLVVAADDGVKPQTIEAINHAKGANVPIIVAITKIDSPKAQIDRVKQELAEHELVGEDWGGKTVVVPVSAKTGEGVNNLLELIVLTSDLLELKAEPEISPEGIIIEANLDKQVGPLATILIYNGTLRPGQVVVSGKTYGRIRSLEDDHGRKLVSAGPAQPVTITGLKDVPGFGDRLEAVPNEKVAKSMTQLVDLKRQSTAKEDEQVLPIIIKADVGGSLAALEDVLGKLRYKRAIIEVISGGIGQVTENDILLASSAKAIIVSFRMAPAKRILELAQKETTLIKEFWVIYEAVDFLTEELNRIATPTFVTVTLGRLKVLKVFSQKNGQAIIGGEVLDGRAQADSQLVIVREKEPVGTAKVTELQIGKLKAEKAEKGDQCGLGLVDISSPIQEGDIVEFTKLQEE
jgi:translation initiation factor IF-2